jgi:hypothetical protein
VTGISSNAMFFNLPSEEGNHTIHSIMLQNENIDEIIPTSTTNTKGRWLVVTPKIIYEKQHDFSTRKPTSSTNTSQMIQAFILKVRTRFDFKNRNLQLYHS